MLNPLNIAPASGTSSGPKTDQTNAQKSELPEAAHAGETFESVLTGAEAKDKAGPSLDPAPDQDELSEMDTPEEDLEEGELADFSALPDPDTVPVAEPDDEMLVISDDDEEPTVLLDDPDSSALAGLVATPGSDAPAVRPSPSDKNPIFAPVGMQQGNRALQPTNAGPARIIAFPPPGDPTVPAETTLADDAPITPAAQLPAEDKRAAKTPGPVQSLLNIALTQQARTAMTPQDKASKPGGIEQPLAPELAQSETATREATTVVKPTIEMAPVALRTPSAAAQAGQVLPLLSEARNIDQDQPIMPRRTKDNARDTVPVFAPGSAPPPPVMPVQQATSTTLGTISALTDLPDTQQDAGRVTWLSETGVFADTGIAPDSNQPSRHSLDQILRNPELPRHLASQIAQVAGRDGADKPVEIRLNPHELGHVKIKMTSVDGSMSVSVIADRPETLDLMRRHINVLAQEFLDIGYGQAQFTFGQNSPQTGGDSSHPTPDTPPQNTGHAPKMAPVSDTIATTRIITDRVDIRL